MLNEGFTGGSITLNDRSFKPTDTNSERLAIFTVAIAPDDQLGEGPKLAIGKWHTLRFAWDLARRSCVIALDGKRALALEQLNLTGNGISYLHVRSKAEAIDRAGFLVESVSVDIDDPVAPARTPEQTQALLDRYLPSYYTAPPERKQAEEEELRLF